MGCFSDKYYSDAMYVCVCMCVCVNTGMDYHFQRDELYFTARDVTGMTAIKRVQMQVTTEEDGTLVFNISLSTFSPTEWGEG